MHRFIRARNCWINLDHVVCIRDREGTRSWFDAIDDKGRTTEVASYELPDFHEEDYHIVPAQPGYEIVSYWPEDGEQPVERTPVIAWRIGADETKDRYADSTIIAIGIGTNSTDGNGREPCVGVRCPDGRMFHHPSMKQWNDLEEWMVWSRKELEKAKASKPKLVEASNE